MSGWLFGAGSDALSSMVFATASLDKAARLLERRAVPSERQGGERLILSRGATHGVPIDLCARKERAAPSPLAGADEAAAISALDHIVVRTPNPERAIASMPDGWGSISGSTAAIPTGARGCCSSAAAIWWSRSRTI